MNMIYNGARALGWVLAIVAAFVAIPNLNVAALLVGLGIVGGVNATAEMAPRVILAAVALPVIGAALGNIPSIGEQLGAIAANLGLSAAGAAATIIGMAMFSRLKADWVK